MAEISDVAVSAEGSKSSAAESEQQPSQHNIKRHADRPAGGHTAPTAGTSQADDAAELPPDVAAAVVKQVEFYFSNTNLPTDEFLLKQIRKSHHGWVNLHVIARFARMKALTNSILGIASALRKSEALVISADGQAVRRKDPLPQADPVDVAERTVVAENLPRGNPSIDSLTKLFSKCGVVKMVRICHPGEAKSVAQVEHGDKNHKHPAHNIIVSNQLHALVEYETPEEADAACKQLTDDQNWRSGLKVRHLLRGAKPAGKWGHEHGDGHHKGQGSSHHGSEHDHSDSSKEMHKPRGSSQHGKEQGNSNGSKEQTKEQQPAKAAKAALEKASSGTIGDSVMAEAIAMARMATHAASHNSEVVKARRRSLEARRSLDSGSADKPHRHSIDVHALPSNQKSRERRQSVLAQPVVSSDFFATSSTATAPAPATHAADPHVAAIKTAARQLQDEVTTTDSGGDTSSGGEDGAAHSKGRNKRKTKAEYAKWASGAIAAGASGHHHDHHGVHQPLMPDGTRGFTMGRGKPLAPPLP